MTSRIASALVAAGLGAGLLIGCGSDGLNRGGQLTGRVTLAGKALQGGNVIVVSEDGKYSVQGFINGQGVYTVPEPPLGKVKLAVQTSHLKGSVLPKAGPVGGKDGPGSAGMVLPDPKDIGLGYTPIPARYEKPETSGLTAEVRPGNQTHDIELTP